MAQWGKGIKLGDCHLPRPPDPPLPSPLPPRLSGECTDRLEAKASELQGLAGLPSPRSAVITLTHPSPPPSGECTDRLEAKASELQGLVSRRSAVLADFDAAVPDSDPFREPLHRLFLR